MKTRLAALMLVYLLSASCTDEATPSWACAQEIPGSKQSLFEATFVGDWGFTSDPWGYAINDASSKIRKADLREFPQGHPLKVTGDGVVHVATSALYDPTVGEKTIRHVIRGVPVVQFIFNEDGNSGQPGRRYVFESVEAAGDRIAFTGVRDESGKWIHERVEVDAGGIDADDKNGVVRELKVYRLDPDPANSAPGIQRRFARDFYVPAEGRTLRLEELPARGICKDLHLGRKN